MRLPLSALLFHAVGFPAAIAEGWSELLLELSFVGFAGAGAVLLADRDWWSRLGDWWSRRFEPGLRRTILEYVRLSPWPQ